VLRSYISVSFLRSLMDTGVIYTRSKYITISHCPSVSLFTSTTVASASHTSFSSHISPITHPCLVLSVLFAVHTSFISCYMLEPCFMTLSLPFPSFAKNHTLQKPSCKKPPLQKTPLCFYIHSYKKDGLRIVEKVSRSYVMLLLRPQMTGHVTREA
jgi:hypothetical protein